MTRGIWQICSIRLHECSPLWGRTEAAAGLTGDNQSKIPSKRGLDAI